MNADELMQRLFDLARRVPESRPMGIPYGLETAVLAHWQEAVAERSATTGLLRSLRWAALTACGIAILAGFFGSEELTAFRQRNDAESRLADSAIAAGYDYE
jgi:hypothetical protein